MPWAQVFNSFHPDPIPQDINWLFEYTPCEEWEILRLIGMGEKFERDLFSGLAEYKRIGFTDLLTCPLCPQACKANLRADNLSFKRGI